MSEVKVEIIIMDEYDETYNESMVVTKCKDKIIISYLWDVMDYFSTTNDEEAIKKYKMLPREDKIKLMESTKSEYLRICDINDWNELLEYMNSMFEMECG